MDLNDFATMFNFMVVYYVAMFVVGVLGVETYPWLKDKYISWREKKQG